MAVIHDACALLTAGNTMNLTCEQQGFEWSSRAVQSVEGMVHTLRLDLLGRTNIAVGIDLPITSWMVRHAAWLLSHFQAGTADGKTAYARQFERPYESPVLPFAERVMWKDPTLQACEVEKQLGVVCGWGDRRQATLTSLAREWASLWLARFDVRT